MNEPLKKITDEKVRDILDKMLGNQQDYMSNILDDHIYKYVTILPETEKDKIYYLRGQK